jgi:hypothetical protein
MKPGSEEEELTTESQRAQRKTQKEKEGKKTIESSQ